MQRILTPKLTSNPLAVQSVDGFIIYSKIYKCLSINTKKVNKIGDFPNNVYSSLINLKPK
jgi:hypothetical protein